jgi:SAM-dependent methyltransferase
MPKLEPTGANARQIEYWNGPAGERWVRLAESQDRMLAGIGRAALDACDIKPGHSVLDTGCGSGSTTLEIARRVGAGGRVLGVDISGPMLGLARSRLGDNPEARVTLENRDVATFPFEAETFDRVFSRFGVMFFVDPVAAFTNIRSGMKSGGKLAFVCWQSMEANPWQGIPFEIALRYLPAPPPSDPRAPGPLAFAEPDWVREILTGSGFVDVEIADAPIKLPIEKDAAISAEKLVQLGPVYRLIGEEAPDIKAKITDEVREAIAPYQTENGIQIDAGTWIVTASSP